MIISSINDKFRAEIYPFSEQVAFEYIDCFDVETSEMCLKLIVIDALKILEIKSRKGSLMLNDTKRLYRELKQLDIDSIIDLLKNDYDYFSCVFLQAKQFFLLPVINRCYVVEELGNYDFNRKLIQLNPFHTVDIVCYKIQNDLDNINYYYKDYKDALGTDYVQRFYPIALDLLKNLKRENIDEFNKSYLEILRIFYMSYKYIDTISNVEFGGKKTSKMLETEDINKAKEEILNDIKLFCEVVSYYFIYTNNELIDKEDVKIFCKKYIKEDMKKKLEIND